MQFKERIKVDCFCQGSAEPAGDLFLPRKPPSDYFCLQRFDVCRDSGSAPLLLAQAFDRSETLGGKLRGTVLKEEAMGRGCRLDVTT